jgi:hypothetical protein
MVYFKTKETNLCIFLRALEWKMFVYFMAVRYNLCPFGNEYGRLVWFVVIWFTFSVLVCLGQEKSGNPAVDGYKDSITSSPRRRHFPARMYRKPFNYLLNSKPGISDQLVIVGERKSRK